MDSRFSHRLVPMPDIDTLNRAGIVSKAEMRSRCRKKWGAKWYKCHPVIKQARLAWASGVVDFGEMVLVKEKDGVEYTV